MENRMKVLVVDDSAIIRQVIEKHLVENFPVVVAGVAENGERALEVFSETNPDYVTLDITMPKIDGLTVLERMLEQKPSVKVMIVTALSDKDTALQAIEMGAKSYLVKPFTPDKFRTAFSRVFEKNGAKQEV